MRIRREGIAIAAIVMVAAGVAVVAALRADVTASRGSGLSKEFSYDLDELRKTDPALIGYEETGRIETAFRKARGIALDAEGRIYVAGDAAVRVFDARGARLREIETGGSPRCLAVSADGTLYVGVEDHIEVFDTAPRQARDAAVSPSNAGEGARAASWESAGPEGVLTSIAVSGKDVFVADAGNRVVLRYDASGEVVGRIGRKGAGRFVVPSPYFDLAVASGEVLWVTNPGRHRVEAYTFVGEFISSWGRPSVQAGGFCGCCNPTHLALFPDGRFVTSEKGLPRVKVYGAEGEFECVVAGPEAFAEGTAGLDLAVDSRGRVLVLDPVARSVRVFEPRKDER